MALPTNRQSLEIIEAADINAIAAEVNGKAEAAHDHDGAYAPLDETGTVPTEHLPPGATFIVVDHGQDPPPDTPTGSIYFERPAP